MCFLIVESEAYGSNIISIFLIRVSIFMTNGCLLTCIKCYYLDSLIYFELCFWGVNEFASYILKENNILFKKLLQECNFAIILPIFSKSANIFEADFSIYYVLTL